MDTDFLSPINASAQRAVEPVSDLAVARQRRLLSQAGHSLDSEELLQSLAIQGSMPAHQRGSMVAAGWQRQPVRGLLAALSGRAQKAAVPVTGVPAWQGAARRRRAALSVLTLGTAVAASATLWSAWPSDEISVLHFAVLGLFALLVAWIAAGFWTAIMGFVVLLRGGDRFAPTHGLSSDDRHRPIDPAARTAIVMPVCNESVATVFGGLRATIESLASTGQGQHFDCFVLSDTRDPELRVQEVAAWTELRAQLAAANVPTRLYYRWRGRRAKKKAGNVADFCRRWGRAYRYMLVLDADSVMSGESLVTLLRLMEAQPAAGIIQTAPRALGQGTLHGRVQQFAQRVTGPLFTAGMQYWQLGESHYWGHNAIIRVAPFMQHCGLAGMAGSGTLDGDVMSHDFVEAALMRRAGWYTWVVPNVAGSYEQLPPSLATEIQRDRRWCHGNLQNLRLVGEPGLHPVHRAMFITGALSYGSAPLWLGFLLLSTVLAWMHATPNATPLGLLQAGHNGSPALLALFGATAAMLMLPKLLALALPIMRNEQRRFGGVQRLLISAVGEFVMSLFLAPVRMMFHAQFVAAAYIGQFTGWKLEWRSPPRAAEAMAWRDAFKVHGPHALIAAVWLGTAVFMLGASAAGWLIPVLLPLMLAPVVSVVGSLPRLGRMLSRAGLFAVPEEAWTPAVLRNAARYAVRVERAVAGLGFKEALLDAHVHARVSAAMSWRQTQNAQRGSVRSALVDRVARVGLHSLKADDKMRLLSEPQALALLRLWVAANGSTPRLSEAANAGSVWADDYLSLVNHGVLPRRAQRRDESI